MKIYTVLHFELECGLSLAFIEDSNITSLKYYGLKSITPPNAIDKNTIFEAASLSKPVFTYGVLKMVENGLIDLDTPLSDYFQYDDVKNDQKLEFITARTVLSHATGFPNWRQNNELIIHFQPGSRFSYSGEGFVYLQKVIEKLSGQSLEEYMQKNVLSPLGMTHSSYLSRKPEDNKAYGYDSAGLLTLKANAASSLHTTVLDYAKFIQAIIKNNGLQEKTINEMLSSQINVEIDGPICICVDKCTGTLSPSVSWGLGWGLQETTNGISFWHWGHNQGFQSYVAGFKNGGAILIFTNSDNGLQAISEIICDITGIEHPALTWLNYT